MTVNRIVRIVARLGLPVTAPENCQTGRCG